METFQAINETTRNKSNNLLLPTKDSIGKKMKTLYIAIQFDYQPGHMISGVSKKIFEQCKALSKLGCETALCLAARERVFLYRFKASSYHLEQSIEINGLFFARNVSIVKIQLMLRLGIIFSDVIKKEKPDLIYIRRLIPLSPFFINSIRKVKGNSIVFWELPTYPYKQEQQRSFDFKNILLEYRSVERLKSFVDTFVVVTEIENIKARKMLGNYIIIPNGFNIASVKQRIAPPLDNEIHILFVATLAFWHGLDRAILALPQYQGKRQYHIHIVSPETEEQQKQKTLASTLELGEHVHFYGALEGSQTDFLFNKCHLAMGSLGRHRTDLNWTSELKLREYAARGIPFVCSSYDKDFLDFKYMLKIPANDEPLEMTNIECFMQSIYSQDHPKQIREYAFEKIDWAKKMKILLQSFGRFYTSKNTAHVNQRSC